MSVLLEAFNVIARSATVARKYPGGIAHYHHVCRNGTCLSDSYLLGVGFLLQSEAADLFDRLILRYRFDPEEIAFVHRQEGVLTPRDWIRWARNGRGRSICWLTGTDPQKVTCSPATGMPPEHTSESAG